MLWSQSKSYKLKPYSKESELEEAVNKVKEPLFGEHRIYLDDKRKIGAKGKTNNLPDGYLIDLMDAANPRIFVVENDLNAHQHLKHIAVQILEFSLSYDSSKIKVKNIIKQMLQSRPEDWKKAEAFARKHNYENVDYLLESIIQETDSFNALLIIDELDEELEKVLISKFQFPVETIVLRCFESKDGDILYDFEPFLHELSEDTQKTEVKEIDTIVVPAREDGFKETFLGEHCWYSIRLNASMIPKIKHIAVYQVAPISAITYIADVKNIEQYKDTNKYIVYLDGEPEKLKQKVKLGKNPNKSPQAPRYASKEAIERAKTLDDVF